MVALDEVCGDVLVRDEEAGKVRAAVDRVVRLGMSLTDLALRGADLTAHDLTDADLTGADLADIKFTGARLTSTYFRGISLWDANFDTIREDLWTVLSLAPREVPAIRAALVEGRVEGGTYYGECACLIGTIANARGCDVYSLGRLGPAPSRPIECFFLGIDRGDTPQTSPIAELVVEWIDEWRARTAA